jgi:hypothetical protein
MFTLKITSKNGFVEQILLGTKYHYVLKSEREQFNDWETIFGEQSRENRPPFDDEYGVLCAGVYRIILTEGNQYEIDIWDSEYKEQVADFNTIYDSFYRGCVE